ncbi:MAG: sigma-E factor negative regulatory protein [Pseudomonadales bacterium]|jgi:sigma-E factor negative regulatory protein RseA
MSEKLKESLSAVMDGEADEFELRRVLDEMGKDAELAGSWERYHLIGAVMRRERIARSVGMREAVWAEAGFEHDAATTDAPRNAMPDAAPAERAPRVGRWAAGVAAVAVVVVIGYMGIGDSDGSPDHAVLAGSAAPDSIETSALPGPGFTLTSEVTPNDQTRTDAYMIRHLQQLGMNGSGIGFAKMVAYERD